MMASEAYGGILDNFASELGSTLEDLVSDWTEADVEYARGAIDTVARRSGAGDSSRSSSFMSQISMSSLDGMADLSLKKARPLYFANPVYDLINMDGTPSKSRQLTLIPLSQFDINKPKDDSSKHSKKKRGSHGLITKLSQLTMKKHNAKKNEPEINVTAPLWTDVPSVKYAEDPRRSSTTTSPSEPEPEQTHQEQKPTQSSPPHSLEIRRDSKKRGTKSPPEKAPRLSKGAHSPLTPTIGQFSPLAPSDNNVFTNEPQGVVKTEIVALGVDAKKLDSLRSAGSNGSLSSDLSEENNLDDVEQAKTMMEVMNEVGDDSAATEQMTQQEFKDDVNDKKKDDQPLKRNKTLKWSGSRAAPALIREFTRKSRRNKQEDNIAVESPALSAESSPQKSPLDDTSGPKTPSKGNAPHKEGKPSKTEKLAMELSTSTPTTPNMNRRDASAFTVLSSLLPPAPKMKRTESSKIRLYIHRMGTNPQNALGYATSQFINQTINSTEHRPIVLLHSIRSFLTDIKRYLVSNPHVGFMTKIQKIVKHSAVSDVEGAIDDALERLVLYPLRDHVYKRLVIEYARSGKIQVLEDAIKVAKAKTSKELGIRETLVPPDDDAMYDINNHFLALQSTYSPFYKLKHLLLAVTTIYQNTSDLTCEDKSARKIGADDFLPLLVYSIVKCDFTAADIEAQYIDGLLDPTLLLGEGGYYLTTMISAVQVLNSMKRKEAALPNISDLQGFLKVGISSKSNKSAESEKEGQAEKQDEDSDQSLLLHKTLHVPPSMTAHNLGMMIAKKYGMKNPKNYCLHVVVNGVAYPLRPQEFPQLVKMDLLTQFSPSSFYFIYRQVEESPRHTKSPERPGTMDTEHLKINKEDGSTETVSAEKESTSVPSVQTTVADVHHSPDEAVSEEAAPSHVPESPSSKVNDLKQEVVDLPSASEDVAEPSATVDLPPPEVDDLPQPDPVASEVIIEQSKSTTDLPPPEVNDLLPPPVSDLPAPVDQKSPQKGLVNRIQDIGATTPYDSEEEIPPFLETYESGDKVDADIATSATTAPSATISDTRKTSDASEHQKTGSKETSETDIITSSNTDVANEAEFPPPPGDKGESPESPFPPPPEEETGSGYSSDYDNVSSLPKVPEENPKPLPKISQEGSVHAVKSTTASVAPSVTITSSCDTSGPSGTSDSNNNLRPADDVMSEASDISSCHSESILGPAGDGRHSRGYHSDGYQIDDIPQHSPSDLGANASVSRLKLYFEEKIIEVAQTAMASQH